MDETPLRDRVGLKRDAITLPADDRGPAFGLSPDAYEPEETHATPSVRGVVRELFETVLFILLVFLIVRGVVQNFKIEGQSMEPNFHSSQYILVNKIVYFHFDLNAPLRLLPGNGDLPARIIYPFHMPRRGEVVVFEYPRDVSKDYIKRVIGLPGETISIHGGHVYVNGQLLDEPYLQGIQTDCRMDDVCGQGRSFVVPPGSIFVLGDNRQNSSDSREWAELPLDRVIGKAWLSYWPRDYWGVVSSPSYASQP
jgi:signal peptidase I